MPSQIYSLDDRHSEQVTVQWDLFWKNFTVLQRGQVIGQLETAQELKQGAAFPLPDGRELSAHLRQKAGIQELELLLDGKPLAGSATDPQHRVRQGLGVLLFIGLANVALGLVGELMQVDVLLGLGLGWGAAVVGLFYLGLRQWAKTRTTPWAFYVAIALLVLDAVLMVGVAASAPNGTNPTTGLVMRFFLCTILFRAAQGAQDLQQESAGVA